MNRSSRAAADIQVEGGQETVGMIKEAGGDAIFVKADVSKERRS